MGDNFRVNDDQGNLDQWNPDISIDKNGNFVIAWTDYRNGDEHAIHYDRNPDIYAQRYANDGTALGDNFRVNDDGGSMYQRSPAVASDDEGNIVITWTDQRNNLDSLYYVVDIYAQRYSSDGNPVGPNFKVNDDHKVGGVHTNIIHSNSSISIDDNGNFIIAWQENLAIYAQRYSKDGSLIGNNFKVSEASGERWKPLVSADTEGNFVITWKSSRNYKSDIFAQRYDVNGSAVGINFRASDARGDVGHFSQSISSEGSGEFIIAWAESYNGDSDIYGQRFSSDGIAIGTNFRLTKTSEKQQTSPAVALFNGRIYNAWTDNRAGGTANDIWANILDWGIPTSVIDKEQSQIPSEFALSQNYPNPFNPTTTIGYALPKAEHVKIDIYDVLGRHIKSLVNTNQSAGQYQTVWDGTDQNNMQVAAGVYFYKMVAGDFQDMDKLLLIK